MAKLITSVPNLFDGVDTVTAEQIMDVIYTALEAYNKSLSAENSAKESSISAGASANSAQQSAEDALAASNSAQEASERASAAAREANEAKAIAASTIVSITITPV